MEPTKQAINLQPESERREGLLIGQKYEIRKLIGRGAWSTVYSGWHVGLGHPVAIKCLHTHLVATDESMKRFQAEAEIAGRLTHSGIIKVFDFGLLQDGTPYIAMDLVEGVTLSAVIQKTGSEKLNCCVKIIRQVADALNYAHSMGVVHRDIKPGNIMVSNNGSDGDIARIVDFGIVKAIAGDHKPEFTQTGDIVGTPQYMSPEQCQGRQVDGKSDVYSLGCVMYEFLSGAPPFDGNNTFDCMRKHFEEMPLPIFGQGASEAEITLESIVMSCLSKESQFRPSPAELSNLLNDFSQHNYSTIKSALVKNRDRMIESSKTGISDKTGSSGSTRSRWASLKVPIFFSVTILIGIASYWFLVSTMHDSLSPHAGTGSQPSRVKTATAIKITGTQEKAHPGDDAVLDDTLLMPEFTLNPNDKLDCQQHEYTQPEESPQHVLNTVLLDINLGIKQLIADGRSAEAVTLNKELKRIRSNIASPSGKYPDSSALHMVAIGYSDNPSANLSGKASASVIVTYNEKPIVLWLNALGTMNWKLTIEKGAKISKIFLVGPRGESRTITGVPPGVPVVDKAVADWERSHYPNPPSPMDLRKRARQVTGLDVATAQTKDYSKDSPWVVGWQSKDWRTQMALRQMESLHAQAMVPVREKIFGWFTQNDITAALCPSTDYRNSAIYNASEILVGRLNPPNKSFDFLPGTLRSNWNIAADQYFRLKVDKKYRAPDSLCMPKVVQAGSERFGVAGTGLIKLMPNGTTKLITSGKEVEYLCVGNDITYDTTRKRLILKDYKTFFAVDPQSEKWSGIAHFQSSAPDGQPPGPDLKAMTYDGTQDCLYFLNVIADYSHYLRWLEKYSVAGKPVSRTLLSYQIPLQNYASTEMYFVEPYLVAISSSAPHESGEVVEDATPGSVHYVWVIDPKSARVLLAAPLRVE